MEKEKLNLEEKEVEELEDVEDVEESDSIQEETTETLENIEPENADEIISILKMVQAIDNKLTNFMSEFNKSQNSNNQSPAETETVKETDDNALLKLLQ